MLFYYRKWITRENEKLNTFTERSIDSYVKSMMKTLPNINKNLIIHEHFDNNEKDSNSNQPIIEKSSFQYDSIEGFQYKPQNANQKYVDKPSTIILDKELINSYSNSSLKSNDKESNKNSLKKSRSKEKIVSSVIMNKEDADKFNELYEQYALKMKKEKELSEKSESDNNKNDKIIENKKDETKIEEDLKKLTIDDEITEKNERLSEQDKEIKDEEIIDKLNNLDINKNKDLDYSSKNDDNEKVEKSSSNEEINKNDSNKNLPRKKSAGILKKSNSVSKENLKVRFNDDPSIRIIENKEEINNAYRVNSKKRKNNKKKGKKEDVFYSYDVIEKSGVQKDVKESNVNETKTEKVEKEEIKNNENENVIVNNNEESEENEENDPEKKMKTLFEMNKDLEKIIKITEMTKEEAKKKQKKKLVPNLSLFGKIWTNISRMITNETRLYLNDKIDEDKLNELLLVDDDIMNTRKDILITNIMKS